MEVLLEDIARTLNASIITLPGNPDESIAYSMSQSSYAEPPNARYRAPLRLPEQLPVDIGRLNITELDDSGIGTVAPSRGIRGVPAAPYQGMPPLLSQPRGLERQLA